MKKMINIRNSVIIILCITIIFMAIGFIVISIDYTKNKNKDLTYNVVFSSIKELSSVKGSNTEPKGKAEINEDSTEIEMNITMNSPHDELSYIATIENKGTVPIEILDIMESPDYKLDSFKKLINPVTITLSDTGSAGVKNFDYKIGLITKSK